MLTAALLEIYGDKESFLNIMNNAGIPGLHADAVTSVKCGITGTYFSVSINGRHEHADEHHHGHEHHGGHEHHHSSLTDIISIIDGLSVSGKVKADAKAVYALIASAETAVHGKTVEPVHFHEVGALDAVADVVGASVLFELIGADEIICSPVNTGSGTVKCAHGIMPVPAPATARLLTGIPSYSAIAESELCTPTGAALLKHFVHRFGQRPVMSISKIGYGMGAKDFEAANCVCAYLEENAAQDDIVCCIACNIDDMSAEGLALACDILFKEGALDVWQTPIVMKKGRLGTKIECLVKPSQREKFIKLILRHTSTIGVRICDMSRAALSREVVEENTACGKIAVKTSSGMGITKRKAEFDSIKAIIENE